MSKNLTRKGLALGAVVALGSTLLAGAPASAAESSLITLAPSVGTTYNVLSGSTFVLKSEIAPEIDADNALQTANKLKFRVENADARQIVPVFASTSTTTDVGTKGSPTANNTYAYKTTSDSVLTAASDTATVSTDFVVNPDLPDNGTYFPAANNYGSASGTSDSTDEDYVYGVDSNAGATTLSLKTNYTDGDVTVKVTAWIDTNNDGEIGTFEATSKSQTVKFVKASTATVTTSVLDATIGAAALQGKVVIGNDINMEMLDKDIQANAGEVRIAFSKNNALVALANPDDNAVHADTDAAVVALDYDSTAKGLINTTPTRDRQALASGTLGNGNYTAQAYYGLDSTTDTNPVKLGSASDLVAAEAGTDSTVDGVAALAVTASANTKTTTAGVDHATQGSTATAAVAVRTGHTAAVEIKGSITKTNEVTAYAKAGITVRITLTKGSTFDSTTSVVAGGKTLTSTSGAVSFNVSTDVDGNYSFTLASNTGKKNDIVNVKAEALLVGGYSDYNDANLTWTDASIQNPIILNNKGANSVLHVTRGGSWTLDVAAVDQYGAAWTTGTYRVDVTTSGAAGEAFAYYPVLSEGKVSQVIVDNASADGSYTVTATLKKVEGSATTTVGSDTVTVYTDAKTPSSLTVAAAPTTAVATTTKALATADLRVDGNSKSTSIIGYQNSSSQVITLSGYVYSALGAVLPGGTVTVAAPGIGFVVNDEIYSVGTASITATSGGAYAVDVFSNVAGKKTITITAGTVVKTVEVEFSGVTAISDKNVLTLVGTKQVLSGATAAVQAKLVDAYGNPIAGTSVTFTATPAIGFLTASSATTDANGVAQVILITGALDNGVTTVTATVTRTDDTSKKLTASQAVSIGASAATAAVAGSTGKAYASVSNAAGKTVVIKINGVTKKTFAGTLAKKTVVVYSTAGAKNVSVFVGGSRVATKVVTIK